MQTKLTSVQFAIIKAMEGNDLTLMRRTAQHWGDTDEEKQYSMVDHFGSAGRRKVTIASVTKLRKLGMIEEMDGSLYRQYRVSAAGIKLILDSQKK